MSALVGRFPRLAETVPRVPLGSFPTRVVRVEGLVPAAVDLWVKREDEASARYGGNKVRKLELILGEATARGARRLVTAGGYGSHHVLATALHARDVGLGVDAVVYPQPITPHVIETFSAGAAVGCRYHATAGYAGVLPRLALLLARPGARFVAPGGSSPLGTLGWVDAGLELAAQIASGACPPFDVAYVALGSLGTAVGLSLGLRLSGLSTRVVGVRVVPRVVASSRRLRALHRATARLLAERAGAPLDPAVARFDPGALQVEQRFAGAAYGAETDAARAAVACAATVGLPLETTYTGKALAALLDDAAHGSLDGRRVLFVDTFSSAPLDALHAPRLPRLAAPAAPPAKETAGPAALPTRLARLSGPNEETLPRGPRDAR